MLSSDEFDVVVVGAGLGGIYAVHKFSQQGLKVVALEKSENIGGVWNHNRYPGARVDVDSLDYSYSFSDELYREWRWSERYGAQSELLAYLNHVVDKFGLRKLIRVSAPLTGALWRPQEQRYHLTAGDGSRLVTRFLVMATGNLSEPRDAPFPGLADFKGDIVSTSRWPERAIEFADRRVAVIGTGSSGVQFSTAVADRVRRLLVFQKTAHYSVPAQNGPINQERYERYCVAPSKVLREQWRRSTQGRYTGSPLGSSKPAAFYSQAEQQDLLERQWAAGGQGMQVVFADQQVNKDANDVVSEFVRNKIRGIVNDRVLAEKLCPKYPLSSRRLILDAGYYEIYNRDNVALVDISESPIERITERGIRTRDAHYEVDLIVLALGFKAFVGAINEANIYNEKGETPTTHWSRGPRTLLGLMTSGFPNFFMLTGPGSPSTRTNMFPENEYHVEWVADCISYMGEKGYTCIEPEIEAQDRWTARVTEAALPLLRLQGNDYCVHVNADGTRVFIPFIGGVDVYTEAADAVAANGYSGFRLSK